MANAGLIEAGTGSVNVAAAVDLVTKKKKEVLGPTEIGGEIVSASGWACNGGSSQLSVNGAFQTQTVTWNSAWFNNRAEDIQMDILVWGDSQVLGNILVWGNGTVVTPNILVWGKHHKRRHPRLGQHPGLGEHHH